MAEKEVESIDEVEKTEKDEEGSFAELFEQSSQAPNSRFSPGDRVTGKVVKIGQDTIFVDLGGRVKAWLRRKNSGMRMAN